MLYVIRPKACKRCGGDLSLECDHFGTYVQCIQCGATYSASDNALYDARVIARSLRATRKPPVVSGQKG
ncbi:MAG: hypothetical protein N2506_04885 [Dehalococcoidales bacterium]|nr:hypothetical protein [Dehalococcoidales bacterium]